MLHLCNINQLEARNTHDYQLPRTLELSLTGEGNKRRDQPISGG